MDGEGESERTIVCMRKIERCTSATAEKRQGRRK